MEDEVVVGEGWAGGVEAEDLGTVMVLVPSLFVYFAVGALDTGDAGICSAGWRLLAGIPDTMSGGLGGYDADLLEVM